MFKDFHPFLDVFHCHFLQSSFRSSDHSPCPPRALTLGWLCLVVWCQRCNRELQLRPCLLGQEGAEGALHMSHFHLLVPAWCFHSSRTFLTLTQVAFVFCVAAITPDVSHLAFVQLVIPPYINSCICLVFV